LHVRSDSDIASHGGVYRGVRGFGKSYSSMGEATIREGATELSCCFRSEQSRDRWPLNLSGFLCGVGGFQRLLTG
jgi:hypothetical protein